MVYTGFRRKPLESAEYRYDVIALDADDDSLSFTLEEGPAGMTIDRATGLISWTAQPSDQGAHPLSRAR